MSKIHNQKKTRLKKQMETTGVSAVMVARATGIHESQISRFKSGERLPKPYHASIIECYFFDDEFTAFDLIFNPYI